MTIRQRMAWGGLFLALCLPWSDGRTAGVDPEPQPARLTWDGRRKEDLCWSPDGRRLACSYYHRTGRIGIARFDEFGQNAGAPSILTEVPVERAPAWSPDGKRLVFVHVTHSGTDGELDIHEMTPDGTERRSLVEHRKSFENFPSWSPDGKRLLFTTTRDQTQELYVAEADGANPKRLTSNPALKQYPRWSPDGRRILFNANPDGNFELYVIGADGSGLQRLTEHPASDTQPAWSPDGRHVAWVTLRDGNPEVYAMQADGSAPRNVSRSPGYDQSPAWKPDGTLTWVSDRDGTLDVYGSKL